MGKKFEKMFKEYAVSQMGRCVKNDTIPDALSTASSGTGAIQWNI